MNKLINRNYGIEVEFGSTISRHEMARKIKTETGVDMQVADYYNKDNTWRLKHDGSISCGRYGMELVTPILRNDLDLQKFLAVLKVCEDNGKVNRSCGVHVHVEIKNQDTMEKSVKKVMKFFGKYENALNGLISKSRRGNNNGYCRDNFYNEEDLYKVFGTINSTSVKTLIKTNTWFNGRDKWNFKNYWSQGTVEFRAHQGTLNGEKIANWVFLTQAIINYALDSRGTIIKKDTTTKTYTRKDMLKELNKKGFISNKMTSYYLTRGEVLDNAIRG